MFAPSVTESASLHYGWEQDSYVFYGYPSESITPRFMDNAMLFDYTVSDNSTDTDDIIIARTAQTRGNTVTGEYKTVITSKPMDKSYSDSKTPGFSAAQYPSAHIMTGKRIKRNIWRH